MKYTRLITLLAASSMLASFSAFAYDKDGDGRHHKKHAPEHRFTLTGGATYLDPTMNGLDYVTFNNTTLSPNNSVNTYNLNPGYDWGYYLGFGYMISKRYDIQANWQQFNSEDSTSEAKSGPNTTMISSNNAAQFLGAGETGTALTRETLKTQAFDANIGQIHKLSKSLMARPYLGIAYGKVDSKTTNTYEATGVDTTSDTYNSKFNGVGPEMGIDAEYTVWDRLGVVGHLGAAFLIGELESDSNVFYSSTQNAVATGNDTRVVPAIDAQIGLAWNKLYANQSWGVGIEGGYQVAYYFDVVDQVQFNSTDNQLEHNFSDVGIMGPYMNVSLDF